MQNNLAKSSMYNLPESFLMGAGEKREKTGNMPGLVYPSFFKGSWIAVDFIGFMKEAASVGISWPVLLLRSVVVDLVRENPAPNTLVCYMRYAHMLKVLFLSDEGCTDNNCGHRLFREYQGYLAEGNKISRPVIIKPVAFWDGKGMVMALWPGGKDGCAHYASDPRILDAGNFLDYSSFPRSMLSMSCNIDRPGSDQMSIPLEPVSMFEYDGVIYTHGNSWFSYPS